jgi:hypothetical protein
MITDGLGACRIDATEKVLRFLPAFQLLSYAD